MLKASSESFNCHFGLGHGLHFHSSHQPDTAVASRYQCHHATLRGIASIRRYRVTRLPQTQMGIWPSKSTENGWSRCSSNKLEAHALPTAYFDVSESFSRIMLNNLVARKDAPIPPSLYLGCGMQPASDGCLAAWPDASRIQLRGKAMEICTWQWNSLRNHSLSGILDHFRLPCLGVFSKQFNTFD